MWQPDSRVCLKGQALLARWDSQAVTEPNHILRGYSAEEPQCEGNPRVGRLVTPHPSLIGLCLHCGKQCRGLWGLAAHSRAVHPESFHSERTASIGAPMAAQAKRWDREETAMMAKQEAKLRGLGFKTFKHAPEDR